MRHHPLHLCNLSRVVDMHSRAHASSPTNRDRRRRRRRRRRNTHTRIHKRIWTHTTHEYSHAHVCCVHIRTHAYIHTHTHAHIFPPINDVRRLTRSCRSWCSLCACVYAYIVREIDRYDEYLFSSASEMYNQVEDKKC
jgi:hypothetical protein